MSDNENAVALFGGGKVAVTDAKAMAAALAGASQDSTTGLPDGGVYISFSGKRGVYSIGEKSADADPEEIWLLNIFAIERGWHCWKGGQPAAKRMASIYGTQVETPDMTEHGPFNSANGEGWSPAKAMTIKSLDRGIQGYFSTSSKSGVNEFAKLEKAVAERIANNEPAWPVIQLQKEEFTAKGNKNYKPILEVACWLGDEQIAALSALTEGDEILTFMADILDGADGAGAEADAKEVAAAKAAAAAAATASPVRRRRAAAG